MDQGREKRKTSDKEIEDGRKRRVREAEGKEAAAAAGSATEEEVDEFFAILKRMQVAAKYFERGIGEGWRAVLEAEVMEKAGAGVDEKKKAAEEAPVVVGEAAVVFDLNVTPEVGEQ